MDLGRREDFVFGAAGDAGLIRVNLGDVPEQIKACRCSWVVVLESADNGGIPGTTTNERYPILRDGVSTDQMRVCHTGKVQGTACGRVEQLDYEADYDGVRVPGLVRTNYCNRKGDSGGPVYAGNTAYGIHSGDSGGDCAGLYQPIRSAENEMDADVIFDKAPTPGEAHFLHSKDQLSLRKYNFYRPDGQLCHYRVRYGDFGSVAYAQVRFYGGPCGGSDVEVFGQHWSGPWDHNSTTAGEDACGPYFEIQATSPTGYSAAGMAVVTPDGNRIRYSHLYTDLTFNDVGPICN